MDEHTAVATMVLCRHEHDVDYMAGEPELASLSSTYTLKDGDESALDTAD